MNIQQAIEFKNKKLKSGNKSDGCTFAPDFWIREACVTHDFLIRFKPVSPWRADWIYFLLMLKMRFPFAPVYYAAVTGRTVLAELFKG